MDPRQESLRKAIIQLVPAISESQLSALDKYARLVSDYADVINLTGFKSFDDIVDGLVVESLRLLEFGVPAAGSRVADLGSGNGSPVVPLAVMAPDVSFTAIDMRTRRVTFLATVKAALGLSNLEVVRGKAELVVEDRQGSYDMVVSRAFATADEMLPLALQYLGGHGEIRGFSGDTCGDVVAAASSLGLSAPATVAYDHKTGRRHVWRLPL